MSKVFRLGCCTNQRTELYAILIAIKYIKQELGLRNYHVTIKTDSKYSIDCVTRWVYGWIQNGWMTKNETPVANKEFIEDIHKYYEKYDITLEHVEAHTGAEDEDSKSNAIADRLAVKATKRAIVERSTDIKSDSVYKNHNRYKKQNQYHKSNNNIVVELIKSKPKNTVQ